MCAVLFCAQDKYLCETPAEIVLCALCANAREMQQEMEPLLNLLPKYLAGVLGPGRFVLGV